MRIWLCFFIISLSLSAVSQGIIIADDAGQEALFSTTDQHVINDFAQTISASYNKVIIHLGREQVFKRGNIYSSRQSQQNLALFCSALKEKGLKVYLWFFDSYGGNSFLELYNEYQSIIDDNIDELERLNIPYDGIAIDMEQINNGGFNNNDKYIEIVKHLRQRIGNKKLYCFASLQDDRNSNLTRGYDTREIMKYADNMIEMLYLQEGDYFEATRSGKPKLNTSRIKELKNYYHRQHWLLAVSLRRAYEIQDGQDKFTFIPSLKDDSQSLLEHAKSKGRRKSKYAIIHDYKIKKDVSYDLKNGSTLTLNKRNALFNVELRGKKLAGRNDFIWEYFTLLEQNTKK